MWDAVLDRVRSEGADASAIDVRDLCTQPTDRAGWEAGLAAQIAAHPGCTLVAHGTAVPLACAVAAQQPPAGLILSNGPIGPMSAAARGLLRPLRALPPRAVLRWLSSSAGLRRTVVNPYVWEHDTVVTVCGPLFGTSDALHLTRSFLSHVPEWAQDQAIIPPNTGLIWGTSDSIFPASQQDFGPNMPPIIPIEGAAHFHPLERPWETADRVLSWAKRDPTTT
jgi:pimeloyl-ACP methyl ester carboxylesterase